MSLHPPLKALLAFDAAMRLRSFSLAAEDLHVTPGAVGQQIRKLEDWLGAALFVRQVRQVQPTPEGLAYWTRIQPALAQILQASRTLRNSRSNAVWLSMPPSLAANWFSRRMSGFLSQHPGIALHLSASTTLLELDSEPIDLVIRYFDGNDPDLDLHLLHADDARLYCSPAYAERLGLRTPDDLVRATLLHNMSHQHWPAWLKRFTHLDEATLAAIPGLHLDHASMAIEAAKRHQGVVLASAMLTQEEIADGTLIEPFPCRLPLTKGYYVAHHRMATLRPVVATLKQWLIDEAARKEH